MQAVFPAKRISTEERLGIEILYAVGFRSAAKWTVSEGRLSYEFHQETEQQLRPLFNVSNALYSFCAEDEVLYIGKTTQSLKRRMAGYCKPGSSQATNLRCHTKIRQFLAGGRDIAILAFTPLNQLQYAGFQINLAAGLEDSLIQGFDPPWNGERNGHVITESAEIESAEVSAPSALPDSPTEEIGQFEIRLGPTYYNQGIVNPGIEASRYLGDHDETLTIRFGDETQPIATRINRRANRTGAVRFVGGNQKIADWLRHDFKINDILTVKILGPNEAEFVAPLRARV